MSNDMSIIFSWTGTLYVRLCLVCSQVRWLSVAYRLLLISYQQPAIADSLALSWRDHDAPYVERVNIHIHGIHLQRTTLT